MISSSLIRVPLVGAAFPALLAACVSGPTSVREVVEQGECVSDDVTAVEAAGECLAILTYGATPGNRGLVVFVHGDDNIPEGGRPRDYLKRVARRVSGDGVTSVVLIRPGHHDSRGRKSSTRGGKFRGDWFSHDVRAIAESIEKLKAHHGVERAVFVGHSIGSQMGAALLGRTTGVVDSAVLIACQCDWYPVMANADDVPTDVEVVAMTGARDDVSPPRAARSYVKRLADRGVPATFMEIPRVGHEAVDTPEIRKEIARLARSS